ncbi:MAG: hypothetical protein ACC700_18700 [Anaerolineales bacterium]
MAISLSDQLWNIYAINEAYLMVGNSKSNGRSRLKNMLLYDPECPGALSERLRAVYVPWLDGVSIDRGARMQDVTAETDEDDE